MKAGIIGAGTWGTALAIILNRNGHEVCIWSKFEEELTALRTTHHHKNLPGAELPDNMQYSSDLQKVVQENELLVMAVPSIYIRSTAEEMKPYVREGQILVSVAKGIEEGTMMTMTDILEQVLPQADVAVLSGPSHAEEVSRLIPTTIVTSAHSESTAKKIQDAFMQPSFRVYINADMKGIEIGAALKNVIALAAGTADGLGYGDNTKAALITRGIAEIARLGVKMGCKPETFGGLSGIGDLIVTCASMHSRNRRAGILIGQGKTPDEAMKEVQQVVEGVFSARAAHQLSVKYQVETPIIDQVCLVLEEGKNPADAVKELMLRDKKIEAGSLDWE